MSNRFEIREDDLSGDAVRALLTLHLSGMHANTPPEHVFALGLDGLRRPEIIVWTVWEGGSLAGIGALKALSDRAGEIKSMRTTPGHLRKGAGSALLEHIIGVGHQRGYQCLSLETGRGNAFEPALALYRKHGFVTGKAFGDYRASDFNQFMHLQLA